MNRDLLRAAVEELITTSDHAKQLADALSMFLGQDISSPPISTKSPRSSQKVTDKELIDAIREAKGLTATEIATQFQMNVSTCYTRLERLLKDGRLTKGEDRKYRRSLEELENGDKN